MVSEIRVSGSSVSISFRSLHRGLVAGGIKEIHRRKGKRCRDGNAGFHFAGSNVSAKKDILSASFVNADYKCVETFRSYQLTADIPTGGIDKVRVY